MIKLSKTQASTLDAFMVALWGATWGDNQTMIGYHQQAMDTAGISWSVQNIAAALVQDWRGSYYTNRLKKLSVEVES